MSVLKRWNGSSWETIGPQISSTRFDDINHMIAPEYSSTSTYNVGDYVVQSDKLYKCISAIESAEGWTAAHWIQVSMGGEVSDLNSAFVYSEHYSKMPWATTAILKSTFPISAIGKFIPAGLDNINISTARRYRCSSEQILFTPEDLIIVVQDGFRFGYSSCDENGTFIKWNGWYSTETNNKIPKDTYFRIQIARISENTSEIANVSEFTNAIRLYNHSADLIRRSTICRNIQCVWESGSIDSSGNNTNASTVIRTADYIYVKGNDSIFVLYKASNDLLFGLHFYNESKVQISATPTYANAPYVVDVPQNAMYVRVNATTINNTVPNESDIVLAYGCKETIDLFNTIKYPDIDLSKTHWEIGSINSSGINTPGSTVIRCDYIDISIYSLLQVKGESGLNYGIHIYDNELKQIYAPSAYITGKIDYEIPNNAKYLRINMTNSNPSLDMYSLLTIKAFSNNLAIQNKLSGNVANGSYNRQGIGERIHLMNREIWDCKIIDFIGFTDSYLINNQSIAIYGNYMFLLQDGGGIAVVDMSSKTIVGTFSSPVTERNHHNSAQFSDYFYADDDEFPLLFVSRCGNTTSAGEYDTCLIYRIQKNNNTFTITLINTIKTDLITYGTSWCVDINEHTITQVGYANDIYSVTTNNPLYVWKWRIPNRSDIISGDNITLLENNTIENAQLPHVTLQAAYAYGGDVFIACDDGVSKISVKRNAYVSKISVSSTREPEGIAIANSHIYVSTRANETNPLIIHQIDV